MHSLVRLALRQFGRKGGLARKANLTPEKLSAIGRKGAAARWAKAALLSTTLLCKGSQA